MLVTCELTIFGLGSHSATGEEWADNDNAGTAAEAQAFKRACSCFGLGSYLYHFTGVWVDLDERKRPKNIPQLFGWATPQGWREGLRPGQEAKRASSNPKPAPDGRDVSAEDAKALVRQIEEMAEPLGWRLYRGHIEDLTSAYGRLEQAAWKASTKQQDKPTPQVQSFLLLSRRIVDLANLLKMEILGSGLCGAVGAPHARKEPF